MTRLGSLVVVATVAAACAGAPDAPPASLGRPTITALTGPTPSEQTGTNALVTRVVDGDTVEVLFRGQELDVRLIGIDTPESVAPEQPVECYALAASRFTTRELEGERVRLELDVERLDQYGRTLGYVWLGDELFNETLLREGYAVVTTYPPNVQYVDRFVRAQREARSAGRGLWGAC